MFQQICQRMCGSFLMTLLFSLAATITPGKDCVEFMTSKQCQCLPNYGSYEIQCHSMEENVKIKIDLWGTKMTLTCNNFNDEEYQILPAFNMSDVIWLRIENCPLPSKPISYLLGVQNLRYFTFENHNLKFNITREHLKGLSNLLQMELNTYDLSLIKEDIFIDMRNLKFLSIKSIKISLARETFAALENLEELHLGVNSLQQLPVGIFHNQRMLVSLDIHHTPLPNITKDLFVDVTSLNLLYLPSNGIESVQSDVFSTLTNLIFIDLSHNNFRYLPYELFANNQKLKEVYLHNSTSLKALPSRLFANLLDLRLVLITCSFRELLFNSVSQNFFYRSERKVLIHCGLNKIPHDLFGNSIETAIIFPPRNTPEMSKATLLEYLDMSHNRLQFLSNNLFDKTPQLTVLKLSHNYLTSISSGLFSNLGKLVELYLDNNRIITTDSSAFSNNQNLGIIHMENNRLNMTDPFRYLPKLEILNLRNNTLRHIFQSHENSILKELDLSHNFIPALNYYDLLPFSLHLFRLNLNFNQITKINITSELLPEFFDRGHLLSVNLNNNPVDCDCNLLPFLHYVRSNLSETRHAQLNFIINELACNKPDYMKDLNLQDIDPKTIYCSFNFKKFPPPHCPLGCNCLKRTSDLVLLVNCSTNNLTEVPTLPRVRKLGLQSIELHLENNELNELPLASTSGYEDVTRIYASRNKFSHINESNLPEHLIYLDLSYNNFKGLNENVLNFFKRNSLLKIALSGNPWNCECKSKPLMQFVGRSYKMVTDIDKVYCASPKNSNMVEYFNTNEVCQNQKNEQGGHITLIASVLSISFVCLVAATAAFYYKYQTEIKIWMYKYNFCSWWVNEEELDKDKTYDAFVSYSSKDDEFVLGQLVPELEKGPIRFKLCVHVRDFIVGGIIPDQIIQAIADSRRTIIVLSKNFIQSVWARMEFRLAHQAGLDEKRAKVIVIVYGEIGDISSLDLELQAYLKMTTYLEWGNPWFWDRLRYIMPHRIRRNDANELELNEI